MLKERRKVGTGGESRKECTLGTDKTKQDEAEKDKAEQSKARQAEQNKQEVFSGRLSRLRQDDEAEKCRTVRDKAKLGKRHP